MSHAPQMRGGGDWHHHGRGTGTERSIFRRAESKGHPHTFQDGAASIVEIISFRCPLLHLSHRLSFIKLPCVFKLRIRGTWSWLRHCGAARWCTGVSVRVLRSVSPRCWSCHVEQLRCPGATRGLTWSGRVLRGTAWRRDDSCAVRGKGARV